MTLSGRRRSTRRCSSCGSGAGSGRVAWSWWAAPCPFYLLVKPAGSVVSPASGERRRYGRHWTPVHLDFVVADVDAAVERALAAGATLDDPAATHSWGRIAHLADPFGNGFCLLQFLGRGYDEIASG